MERNALTLPSPRQVLPGCKWVTILHPFHNKTLLSLPAYATLPLNSGNPPQYVVDYQLVMDACSVITNGKGGDVHLVRKQDNTRVPDDTITLVSGDHFYHLDSSTHETPADYEVVTEFAAWKFVLPPHWALFQTSKEELVELHQQFRPVSISAMSDVVKTTDGHCIITKYRNMIQNAHIIPKDQIDWFETYEMQRYGVGNLQSGIHNPANGITLRADVRLCLDQHYFVICPAGDHFKTHMVAIDDDYAELLHRRVVEIPARVSVEFLYARFAYTMISCIPAASVKFFNCAEPSDEVVKTKVARLKEEEDKMRERELEISNPSGERESASRSDGSTESMEPTEDYYADLDKRWRDRFIREHPNLVEESLYPPETRNDQHIESPRMLRLMSKYIYDNPQVWQTSTTPSGSVRWDTEGFQVKVWDIVVKDE